MNLPLLISIIAIIISLLSIAWQIFIYWDFKRGKIKITTDFEHKEGDRFNAIQDCFIRFYIINTGRSKVLITGIAPEYIVKEQKDILRYHFRDEISKEYPISIGIDEHYLQKVFIELERYLEVIDFATEGDARWLIDKFTAQKVRIVVQDIRGSKYFSKWIDYKDPWLNETAT